MAKEKEELDAQVEAYWKSCNECLVKDAIVSEKAASVHLHLQTEMEELTKLNRTNILNEAFHIWFDGHFGTINNFRLGKMPSEVHPLPSPHHFTRCPVRCPHCLPPTPSQDAQ